MKDPRRLLDDATLTDVERRALLAARAAEPSPELVDELWTNLAATTGAAAAATGAAASASHGAALAHGTAGKLAVLKALVLGAAVGTVTTGSVVAVSRIVSAEHREARAVAAERANATRARAASQPREVAAQAARGTTAPEQRLPSEPLPVITGVAPVASAAPNAKPAAQPPAPQPEPPASSNAVAAFQGSAVSAEAPGSVAGKDEARLVGVAREMLATNDPTSAMVILNEAARRYPRGILQQEREALTISTLAQTGKMAEAAARARAFLRAFPDSPHAARVQRALGP